MRTLVANDLRNTLGVDEAGGLDPAQPGFCEAPDQLEARLDGKHLLLVLEPVARADLAERRANDRRDPSC